MKFQLLDRLQQDHRNIEILLRILGRQLDGIRRGDRPDYQLMYQIIHYLTYYPDRHHHIVEDILFTRLAEKRPAMRPILQTLHGQHDELSGYGILLRGMICDVLGDLPVARSSLCELGKAYVQAYENHLHCEERHVFDQLQKAFSDSDWMNLVTTVELRTDPLFARESALEYRHLSEQLTVMNAGYPISENDTDQTCPICSSMDEAGTAVPDNPEDR